MDKHHRYEYHFGSDGDYIVLHAFNAEAGEWREHTHWLIPGTQLEG